LAIHAVFLNFPLLEKQFCLLPACMDIPCTEVDSCGKKKQKESMV